MSDRLNGKCCGVFTATTASRPRAVAYSRFGLPVPTGDCSSTLQTLEPRKQWKHTRFHQSLRQISPKFQQKSKLHHNLNRTSAVATQKLVTPTTTNESSEMKPNKTLVAWTFLLALSCLYRASDACSRMDWIDGYMDASHELEVSPVRLSPEQPDSLCFCCALCQARPDCASMSFSWELQQCRLFKSVAGYATLIVDPMWEYFTVSGRSSHHQFCKTDGDCTHSGDFCRARVCTNETAVTCKTIKHTFGAGENFGLVVEKMHGWLNEEPLALNCLMDSVHDGATRVLKHVNGEVLTSTQLRGLLNADLSNPFSSHSILGLADEIRDLGTEDHYRVFLVTNGGATTTTFTLPRTEPVVSDPRDDMAIIERRHSVTTIRSSLHTLELTAPYYEDMDPNSLAMISLRADNLNRYNVPGAMVRSDGVITDWGGANIASHQLFVRE